MLPRVRIVLVLETAVIDNHMQSLCSSLLTVFLTIKEFLETDQITVYYNIFFQGRSTKVFLDGASRGDTSQHPPNTKICQSLLSQTKSCLAEEGKSSTDISIERLS